MLKTVGHPTVFGSMRELPPRITFQSLSFFSHALFLGRKTVLLTLEKLSLSQRHPDCNRQTQKEDLSSLQRGLRCADEPGIGWVTLCRNEVLGSQCGCTLLCLPIQLLFICSSNYLRIPLLPGTLLRTYGSVTKLWFLSLSAQFLSFFLLFLFFFNLGLHSVPCGTLGIEPALSSLEAES